MAFKFFAIFITVFMQISCVRTSIIAGHTVAEQPAAPVTIPPMQLSTSVDKVLEVIVGESAEIKVTLKNSSSVDVKNIAITKVDAPWALTGSTCNSIITVGSSCVLTYKFSPLEVTSSNLEIKVTYDKSSTTSYKLVAAGYRVTEVTAAYPTSGANWNDYVKRTSFTDDKLSQPDSPCNPALDVKFGNCLHGGEHRKAKLLGLSNCNDVKITDSLSAFRWVCRASGADVSAHSVGLNEDKRLNDLVDATSWKEIYITVKQAGALTHRSAASKTWWGNTVAQLPANTASTDAVQTLSTASVVYAVKSSITTSGYNLNADKIAIAMDPSASITWSGSATNNVATTTGETTGANNTAVFAAGGQNYLWLEGDYNSDSTLTTDANYTFFIFDGSYHKFRKINIIGKGTAGLYLSDNTKNNTVIYAKGRNVAGGGRPLYDRGTANIFNKITSHASTGSDALRIVKRFIHTELQIVGNNTSGIVVNGGVGEAIIHAVTSINNGGTGVSLGSTNKMSLSQLLVGNNAMGGLSASGDPHIYANVVTFRNTSFDISAANLSNTSKALYNFVAGTNICQDGLANGNTAISATCTSQNGSTANVLNSIASVGSSFVGTVSAGDAKNTSDTAGSQLSASVTDWFNFENLYRSWVMPHQGFPNDSQQIDCLSSTTCEIADFRLSKNDSVIRNRSNSFSALNDAFVGGKTCPAAVNGNVAIDLDVTNFGTWIATTYLANAVEIMEDEYGDDDGICESGEACLYHPNYGAYLGEGDWLNNGTCTFQDGAVYGVKMYAYPTNGG